MENMEILHTVEIRNITLIAGWGNDGVGKVWADMEGLPIWAWTQGRSALRAAFDDAVDALKDGGWQP